MKIVLKLILNSQDLLLINNILLKYNYNIYIFYGAKIKTHLKNLVKLIKFLNIFRKMKGIKLFLMIMNMMMKTILNIHMRKKRCRIININNYLILH